MEGLVAGHPPRGVAILWRDSLDSQLNQLQQIYHGVPCIGIEIEDN